MYDAIKPDKESVDCYNRVVKECNEKYPDKNWGDKEYRDYISAGLEWCGNTQKIGVVPVMDDKGRNSVVEVQAAVAMRKPSGPDPGSDDCYNRTTTTCNDRHPGKNMGDKEYRDCINDLLDWCDENEPVAARRFAVLDSQGRFVVVDSD